MDTPTAHASKPGPHRPHPARRRTDGIVGSRPPRAKMLCTWSQGPKHRSTKAKGSPQTGHSKGSTPYAPGGVRPTWEPARRRLGQASVGSAPREPEPDTARQRLQKRPA